VFLEDIMAIVTLGDNNNMSIYGRSFSLKSLNHCRVCDSSLFVVEKIKNVPIDGMELLKKPIEPTCFDFDLLKCSVCGHYQISNIDNFQYANDWNNTSNLDSILDTWRKSIKYLSSIVQSHNKAFEMLCGTGILGEGEKYFQQIIREGPEKLITGNKKNNHTAIYDYAVPDLSKNTFDAFYLYDVLAHIENVSDVLKDAFLILKEGGAGWIEVPNGLTIINKRQYFSILPEHINYFTPHSLSTLVESAGFQTILIQPSLGGDHLDIFFRKPESCLSISEVMVRQFKFILDEVSKHKKVVIWGAGAKAHQIFGYLSDKLQVTHIVDSGVHKYGLFIPGAQVYVEAPSEEIFTESDLVVIFAVSFEEEITAILRNKYHYQGGILSLSHSL
jgi:hypothetical protein